ncbi:MAG: ABC transporter permease [Corynebacterium sp.]|nr:ABC transporter permease [Corynebacterium sp.]
MVTEDVTFTAGTFSPNPQRANIRSMLRAQALIEAKLFLRHGEQLLLSFIIPVCMLIAITIIPIIKQDEPMRIAFPIVLAIAAMSSGFTGEAISLAFDRRYGALKRTGASGVPAWTIIVGKILGLLAVAVIQIIVLTSIALALGWSSSFGGILTGTIVFLCGITTFTALGMLMGGTLSSELVLGLANLIWVLLVGGASYLIFNHDTFPIALNAIPSIALASGLLHGFDGHIPLVSIVSLLVWTVVGVAAATRWFKFAD